MAEYGFVYVLGNECMPGIYKIGFTTNHPQVRANQLSASTSCPTPFEIYACVGAESPEKMERDIHERLSNFRINDSREFFDAPAEVIMNELFNHHLRDSIMYAGQLEDQIRIEKKEFRQKWLLDHFLNQEADPFDPPKKLVFPF